MNKPEFFNRNRRFFRVLFYLFFFFISGFESVDAQGLKYAVVAEQLKIEDLRDLSITDMVIDSSGVFLITTSNNGIFKYDGEVLLPINDSYGEKINSFYTSISSISPDEWILGSVGIYVLKNNSILKDINFPDSMATCVDLLNTGMGRIYALTSSRLYYRGINSERWFQDTIPGLDGAYQISQQRGAIIIASKNGLWSRSVSGLWTQLIDKTVSSSIPLGDQLLAITENGLEKWDKSSWVLLEPNIKGYNSYTRTKDGSAVWIYGESGLWFIRSDGRCTKLYTQGGLFLETITSGCLTGSGGLMLAEENSLIRINAPSVWYDLRTLPYNIGKINSIAPISEDSCWINTSVGLYYLGKKSFENIKLPSGGISIGILNVPDIGIISFGEFGAANWTDGNWNHFYKAGWVYDAEFSGVGIMMSTPKGSVFAARNFENEELWNFESFIDSVFVKSRKKTLNGNDIIGFSTFGLFVKSVKCELEKTLNPALLIRDINRGSVQGGEPIIVRLGIRGAENLSDEILLKYRVNKGLWISIGSGRRIVLDRLRPGNHNLEVRAEIPHQDHISPVSYNVQIEYPSWRRPEVFITSLGFIIMILLVIASGIRKRRKEKKKWLKEKLKLERMALRLQMNPHFTFNALESISAYILDSNPKEAVIYLQKFSRLMRYTLESADQSYVSLTKERKALENYISLEQMRFKDGFQSVVQFDSDLDEKELAIPPMLIQPLVENAILHGLRPLLKEKRNNGLLRMAFMSHPQLPESLLIQIDDNGVGRSASRINKSGDEGENRSAATKILSKRLEAMRLESGLNHEVHVQDLDAGTRVSLVLPLIRNWELSE